MPGSGKSTVGRHLARRLGVPFTDSDQEIESRIGCSIREFFERHGEDKFRDVEESIIDEITHGEQGILATGGGVVLREMNRQHLRTRSTVVYLRSTPEELVRRLRNDANRPLLQVSDPLSRLRELFSKRDPLYRMTAHFSISTGRPSISTLVNMIIMQLDLADITSQKHLRD